MLLEIETVRAFVRIISIPDEELFSKIFQVFYC